MTPEKWFEVVQALSKRIDAGEKVTQKDFDQLQKALPDEDAGEVLALLAARAGLLK